MYLPDYLESTYLKQEDKNSSIQQTIKIVKDLINEAIKYKFKLVMIRPEHIDMANKLISQQESELLIGTVIDFPAGDKSTDQKITEATSVIKKGVSDLDFVADYNSFKRGVLEKFDHDIVEASRLCFNHHKTIKWIIETGALSKEQIFNISKRIYNLIRYNFPSNKDHVFIKTSTGYYQGKGATVEDIQIIKAAAEEIHIKASGGIKNYNDCIRMIEAGATRIGTSNALLIYNKK